MIEKVVIFGDSFNYGHGCKDRIFYYDQKTKQMVGTKCPENSPSQYSWGSLLQEKYPQIKVYNFANPGRSNQHIFRDFLEYSKSNTGNRENQIVFFQLSNPDRIEVMKNSKETFSYVLSNAAQQMDDTGAAIRTYIKYMYHPMIGENLGFMTILSAFALAKIQRMYNFYWSCSRINYPLDTYDFLLSSNDLKTREITDIRNYIFGERFDDEIDRLHRSPDNHTNELGHQIYFDSVIDTIIKKHL